MMCTTILLTHLLAVTLCVSGYIWPPTSQCDPEHEECANLTSCKGVFPRALKFCGEDGHGRYKTCCKKPRNDADEALVSRISPEGCGIRTPDAEDAFRLIQVPLIRMFTPAAIQGLLLDLNLLLPFLNSSSQEVLRNATAEGNEESAANREARVAGGESTLYKWPFMAGIYVVSRRYVRKFFFCGATVIGPRHVITAAHCFDGSNDTAHFNVTVGGRFRQLSEPEYEIEEIKIHESYSPTAKLIHDDIAILRLKEALPDAITPVCIPAKNTLRTGDLTTVLGWGKFSDDGPAPDVLQEMHSFPINNNDECNSRLYTWLFTSRYISDSQICGGGLAEGGVDTCQGDSGGPLLRHHKDGRWFLEGIVSYGYRCGYPGMPGIYTRVTSYLEWIENFVDPEGAAK